MPAGGARRASSGCCRARACPSCRAALRSAPEISPSWPRSAWRSPSARPSIATTFVLMSLSASRSPRPRSGSGSDEWIVACTAVGAASVRALDADLGFLDPTAPLQAGGEIAAAMRADRRHDVAGAIRPGGVRRRSLPQILGALDEAARHLLAVVTDEINTAAENPLIDTAGTRALHHGGFHQIRLALATD